MTWRHVLRQQTAYTKYNRGRVVCEFSFMSNAALSMATYRIEWLRDLYRIRRGKQRIAILAPHEIQCRFKLGT